MPRRNRCVLPEVPCHVTQRGVDRCETFSCDNDRATYLRLLRDNLAEAEARVLGYCVMTNHVHLIALPEREDSLAILLRRVHGRYAQYYNTHYGRTGHLWQNRFFACILGPSHLWAALAYVESNPVRAGIVEQAEEYRWSSAAAHLWGTDPIGILDMQWWQREGPGPDWAHTLAKDNEDAASELRRSTYSGRPFGDTVFVEEMSRQFGRSWERGRPPKQRPTLNEISQLKLFAE